MTSTREDIKINITLDKQEKGINKKQKQKSIHIKEKWN